MNVSEFGLPESPAVRVFTSKPIQEFLSIETVSVSQLGA
jgi:hypothetical protein